MAHKRVGRKNGKKSRGMGPVAQNHKQRKRSKLTNSKIISSMRK